MFKQLLNRWRSRGEAQRQTLHTPYGEFERYSDDCTWDLWVPTAPDEGYEFRVLNDGGQPHPFFLERFAMIREQIPSLEALARREIAQVKERMTLESVDCREFETDLALYFCYEEYPITSDSQQLTSYFERVKVFFKDGKIVRAEAEIEDVESLKKLD